MQAKWARRRMQRRMVENFHRKYGEGRTLLSSSGAEFAIPENLWPVFTRRLHSHHWAAKLATIPKQFWMDVKL